MRDAGTSVEIVKQGLQPKLAEYATWIRRKYMRKILSLVLFTTLVALGVEGLSAYILYRHFSNLHRDFYPAGSATVALARDVIAKARGRSNEVDLSIDHGPLFHADAELGYSMYPGSYQITEKRDGRSHRFTLTVDDSGRRITSYLASGNSKRMYIAGDSALFGWGLDDEQTIPWLLQTRFPKVDVINLSLTSYSTIHSMIQLERISPAMTADDIVVLTYHLITNDFNVASAEMLGYLKSGFEQQLGDPDLLKNMMIPYGSIDSHGELEIRQFDMGCAKQHSARPQCSRPHASSRPQASSHEAVQVTEQAFDAIMTAYPAHFVVAFLGGPDSDPVIAHLRSKDVVIADLRTASGDPDANDEVSIDEHAGPFSHHTLYLRLADALRRAHLVD
jgi:hypothetical protein